MKMDNENTKIKEVIQDLQSVIKKLQGDMEFYKGRLPMDIETPLYDNMISDIAEMVKELGEKSQKLRGIKLQKIQERIDRGELKIL